MCPRHGAVSRERKQKGTKKKVRWCEISFGGGGSLTAWRMSSVFLNQCCVD